MFLGDHQNDLKAGISAGASVIGCLYGYSLTETDKEIYDCMFVDAPTEIILKINS